MPGQSLSQFLQERGRLDEPTAVCIMADVCRALVDAHQRGIVHRDVKPENILLSIVDCRLPIEKAKSAIDNPQSKMVKLSDFGLARHVVETDSLNVTQAGAILGTPLYMAPEQCSGQGRIDPRTDVYAVGATLFHLLAGRPPFVADGPLQVIAMHCNEPPPPLKKLVAELSEGVCQIVDKALSKVPDLRYPDAAALLADLERLLRGEPTTIVVHPQLPACDPAKVVKYDWTWELEASPAQLWPQVSNTERFNKAIGLSAVEWNTKAGADGRVQRSGKFRKAGMTMAWQEHPFEWIEGRRFGVLREFTEGPFTWFISQVEMTPRPDGGTTLNHRLRLEPRNLLGRTVAAV